MDYIYCQFFKTECRFHFGFAVDFVSPAKELYLLRNKGNIFSISYLKGDDITWPIVKCVGQSQIAIGAWEDLFCQHYIWNREDEFEKQLLQITPAEFPAFLKRREGELIRSERPWAAYMRTKFREKGVLQQEVFLAADLSERYGYKLIIGDYGAVLKSFVLKAGDSVRLTLEKNIALQISEGTCTLTAD